MSKPISPPASLDDRVKKLEGLFAILKVWAAVLGIGKSGRCPRWVSHHAEEIAYR